MKNNIKSWVRSQLRDWRRLCILLSTVLGLPLSVLAESPAQVDRLTQQWLDIERQASHLQSEWKAQQPVLSQRLILLRAEKQQLRALLKRSSASEDDVATSRAELLEQQAELEQRQTQLSRALTLLILRLESIAPMLPPALSTIWQDEQNTLTDSAETSLRLQVALAQLTRLADFDKRVSVHESTVTADDGHTLLVKQLYLGVGVAWFVSRDGQQAGWGQASDAGWEWQFDGSVNADEVSKAIATFERRQSAELVRLPVRLAVQRTTNDEHTTNDERNEDSNNSEGAQR